MISEAGLEMIVEDIIKNTSLRIFDVKKKKRLLVFIRIFKNYISLELLKAV